MNHELPHPLNRPLSALLIPLHQFSITKKSLLSHRLYRISFKRFPCILTFTFFFYSIDILLSLSLSLVARFFHIASMILVIIYEWKILLILNNKSITIFISRIKNRAFDQNSSLFKNSY